MASRQVEFANNDEDDAALVGWFEEQGEFFCLPAVVPVGEAATPLPLAAATAQRIVVFRAEHSEMVVAGHVTNDAGETVYSSPDNDGLVIEWAKTKNPSKNLYVPMGGGGGRLYIRDPELPTLVSKANRRLLQKLIGRIQRTYPWIAESQNPIYVGASLGQSVQKGIAKLQFPNGKEMRIKPNPKLAE